MATSCSGSSERPSLPEQARASDYLRRKGTLAPVADLRGQLAAAFRGIEAGFGQVAPDERALAPRPGAWSPHQILDHLVISHEPAVLQLAALLRGETPGGVAIPADLSTPEADRRPWDELIAGLAALHERLEALLADVGDDRSLGPKAVVEMVVKADTGGPAPTPVHWFEELDWKAFVQALRVHTREHQGQLDRTLTALRLGR
jgi:DinB superfamily